MGAYAKTRAVQFPAKTTLAVSFETACVAARISYASLCTFRLTLQRAGTYAHRSNFYQRDLTKEGRSCGQWRELRALVRGPIQTSMGENRRTAKASPGPQHTSFLGWKRATPARSTV